MVGSDGRHYFPAVSDDKRLAGDTDLPSARPGQQTVWDEELFVATGDEYEKGPRIGVVTIRHLTTTDAARVFAEAIFSFLDENDVEYGTVKYDGWVPGNGSWNGRARFGFASGSPRDDGEWPPHIFVLAQNPKRWG